MPKQGASWHVNGHAQADPDLEESFLHGHLGPNEVNLGEQSHLVDDTAPFATAHDSQHQQHKLDARLMDQMQLHLHAFVGHADAASLGMHTIASQGCQTVPDFMAEGMSQYLVMEGDLSHAEGFLNASYTVPPLDGSLLTQ